MLHVLAVQMWVFFSPLLRNSLGFIYLWIMLINILNLGHKHKWGQDPIEIEGVIMAWAQNGAGTLLKCKELLLW